MVDGGRDEAVPDPSRDLSRGSDTDRGASGARRGRGPGPECSPGSVRSLRALPRTHPAA